MQKNPFPLSYRDVAANRETFLLSTLTVGPGRPSFPLLSMGSAVSKWQRRRWRNNGRPRPTAAPPCTNDAT